ncbi:MAG: sensor histidine kinase [Gaiellaceae bacterium]
MAAEQDERRRLALALHDGPVQTLSGIALMLDAVRESLDAGRADEAREVLANVLDRQRDTIRSLRDLSFALEPVILRDQGFSPAVRALAAQLGLSNELQIDLDVDAGDDLSEKAKVALYQIVREALHQSIRRGPPTRISVVVAPASDGGAEVVISDDAPGERRLRSFEPIEERARSIAGRVTVEAGGDAGTTVRVVLPPYTAR